MTRKLKSETSSQKIDVSADIIFGSLTLQSDFVILDLKWSSMEANTMSISGNMTIAHS